MLVFGGFIKHTSGHPNTVFNTSAASGPSTLRPVSGAALAPMPTAPNRELDAAWTGQVAVVLRGRRRGPSRDVRVQPDRQHLVSWLRGAPGWHPDRTVGRRGRATRSWRGAGSATPSRDRRPEGTALDQAAGHLAGRRVRVQPDDPQVDSDRGCAGLGRRFGDGLDRTDWMVYGGMQITAGVQTPIPGGYSYDPGPTPG